jgi:hypothetical protein
MSAGWEDEEEESVERIGEKSPARSRSRDREEEIAAKERIFRQWHGSVNADDNEARNRHGDHHEQIKNCAKRRRRHPDCRKALKMRTTDKRLNSCVRKVWPPSSSAASERPWKAPWSCIRTAAAGLA